MSLSKLFAPPDDPDYDEPITREDWLGIAIEVGLPFLVAAVAGIYSAGDLAERYGEGVLARLDPVLIVGFVVLAGMAWSFWSAAKRRRGRF